VIKPGVVTAEILRRFDRETQVLGRLQHPGIAQIYDAGTTPRRPAASPTSRWSMWPTGVRLPRTRRRPR
jgi:serine/threonine protein kinase